MRKGRILGVVAISIVLLASACGSTSSDGTASGSTSPSTGGVPTNADPTAILKFGGYAPQVLDPIRPSYNCETSSLNLIFDTLVAIDSNGEFQPRLATGWEVMPNNVLRLTLRDGVTFQDGTPFDAAAVKFNLDRAQTDAQSLIKTQLSTVTNVAVVDPKTIDLTLNAPVAGNVLAALADRAGMMASPTAVKAAGTSEAFSLAPVGAGMYKINGTWNPRENISVRAWDGYWDKQAAALGGIDLVELTGEAQLNAIQAGDVELSVIDDASSADTLASSGFTVDVSPSNQYGLFILNETKPPLDNLKVRQAISYAIDRQAIAQALTFGKSDAAYQFFPPSSPIYDSSLDSLYPHDVDKAKQLLADAGMADGFQLNAAVGNASPLYIQMGELIAGQLKEVGIDMKLNLIDQASANNEIVRNGTYPAAPYGGQTLANTGKQFNDYFMPGGVNNAGNNEAPGLADILTQAGASTDASTRNELFRQANKIVTDQVQNGVPIYFQPSVTVSKPYVGGVVDGQLRCLFDFRGVYVTQGQSPVGS